MTTAWEPFVAAESRRRFALAGFQLVDDLTGGRPQGRPRVRLERLVDGDWQQADQVRSVTTLSGILAFPDLGRRADASGQGPVSWRLFVQLADYRPLFQKDAASLAFTVHPYDERQDPAAIPSGPTLVPLLPAPSYAFPPQMSVQHGLVRDAQGAGVADVLISATAGGQAERCLSDEAGRFALPLRFAADGDLIQLQADHLPTGRSGTAQSQIPGALNTATNITIT